jgi:hypothetical protein
MRGAIPPLLRTSSWRGVALNYAAGQLYIFSAYLFLYENSTFNKVPHFRNKWFCCQSCNICTLWTLYSAVCCKCSTAHLSLAWLTCHFNFLAPVPGVLALWIVMILPFLMPNHWIFAVCCSTTYWFCWNAFIEAYFFPFRTTLWLIRRTALTVVQICTPW